MGQNHSRRRLLNMPVEVETSPAIDRGAASDGFMSSVLESLASSLSKCAEYAPTIELGDRFEVFAYVLDMVADLAEGVRVADICSGSLDDPLTLFVVNLAALRRMFDGCSIAQVEDKLPAINLRLPAAIDSTDLRSKPLLALYELVAVMKQTATKMENIRLKRRTSGAPTVLH